MEVILHKHHIVPKHMGGTDDESNILVCNTSVHAEMHKTLYEEHGKLHDYLAWQGLSGMMGRDEIIRTLLTAPKSETTKERMRERAKQRPPGYFTRNGPLVSAALKGKYVGENHPMWGHRHSEETKKRMSVLKQRKMLTWNGQTMSQSEWAKVTGLSPEVIAYRLKAGWDIERTLSTPKGAVPAWNKGHRKTDAASKEKE